MTFLDPESATVAIGLIGLVVLAAFAADALAIRFRIPDVLWLIVIGLIIGPALHLVSAASVTTIGAVVGTAALILILYDAVLDLEIGEARRFAGPALYIALASYLSATAVLFVVGFTVLSPGNVGLSLIFALALACTSGAIIIPIAHRMGYSTHLRGTIDLEAAFEDVISVVGVSILVTVLVGGTSNYTGIALAVALPLPVGIAIGAVGGFLSIEFLTRWQRRPYAALGMLGVLFVVYAVAKVLGGSGVIAVLVVGMFLANELYIRKWTAPRSTAQPFAMDRTVRRVQNEVAFLLRALFLVILGIMVPIQPMGIGLVAIVIALPFVLYYLRWAVTLPAERRGRIEPGGAARVAALYGRGLTSAVLLIISIAVLPEIQGILLPAFLLIIGTDVVMTVLTFWGSRAPAGGPPGARAEGSAPLPSEEPFVPYLPTLPPQPP